MLTEILKRLIIEAIEKEIKKLREGVALLLKLIDDLEELKKKYLNEPEEAFRIVFYTTINGEKKEVSHMFLKVSQKLPISIEIKDKFGNAAQVDGAPVWAVSDAALGAVNAAEGGLSAEFVPAGLVGQVKVQVSCDADLGEGVKSILGELSIDLLAGEAVVVELKAGEAVDA